MMFQIPPILSSDELLDSAFRKASKVQVVAGSRYERHRKMGIAKVRRAAGSISSTLTRYVKSFPNFEALPGFYYDLFDVTVGVDGVRKSLGALSWCTKTVKRIADDSAGQIYHMNDKELIKRQVGSTFGRISSVVKQVSGDLTLLKEARDVFKKTPQISVEMPTLVIAGAPNVGKSLLVSRISSARPRIAAYPFTTKGILVGHFTREGITYQVIDTPGLLDREMAKRNEMEIKAILALKHLANVIIFLLDPSEHCGYSMDFQLNILRDIRSALGDVPILEVENKKDIVSTASDRIKVSALGGEGINELKDIVYDLIRETAG